MTPRIVVAACAAIEQIGYFATFKLCGCGRNAKSVFAAAACQIVAVDLGATTSANAADIFVRARNRSCVVAVGCGALIAANAANIRGRTRNRSCVVAVGYGYWEITIICENTSLAANAANILTTMDIRINNPDILYRSISSTSFGIAYQTHIVAAIGVVAVSCIFEIQTANGVAVAVECACKWFIFSSNRCPTIHCCAVEIAISRYV